MKKAEEKDDLLRKNYRRIAIILRDTFSLSGFSSLKKEEVFRKLADATNLNIDLLDEAIIELNKIIEGFLTNYEYGGKQMIKINESVPIEVIVQSIEKHLK